MVRLREWMMVVRRLLWLLSPRALPRMGTNCRIHPMARFEGHASNIVLGNNVSIGAYAVFHCHKDGHIRVGDGCHFGDFTVVNTGNRGGHIEIGCECTVQNFSMVFGNGGCRMGSRISIGSHCTIIPHNHNFRDPEIPIRQQGRTTLGITLGNDIWLGAGVAVLDGCRIGEGCVLAAGAVVTKSVDAFHVVAGVPARTVSIRTRKRSDEPLPEA